MTDRGAQPVGEPSLVVRFLGPDAATGGMHAILGLPARAHDQDAIIRALDRQLMRLDNHPQARTPEADEVRLALHAAAAQLVHQAAHRERSIKGRSGAKLSQTPARRLLRLEQDALLTLAQFGGWNRRAMRRLSMLALARGADYKDVAKVLESLARRKGRSAPQHDKPVRVPRKRRSASPKHDELGQEALPKDVQAQPMPAPSTEPMATALEPGVPEVHEGEGVPKAAMVAIGSGLTLVVAFALVLIVVTSGGDAPPPPPPPPPDLTRSTPSAADLPLAAGEELFPMATGTEEPVESEEQLQTFSRLSDALAALDTAADGLEIDRDQARRVFAGAFASVGERWCMLTVAQQRAAHHDVVEFVYRSVQDPSQVEGVVDAIASGSLVLAQDPVEIDAEDVWPAAWSVGILARLMRERDIGARASREIEDALREAVGSNVVVAGGFEQGVVTALWEMLPSMVADRGALTDQDLADRWNRWIDAARFTGTDTQPTLISALEWVLLSPNDPSDSDAVRTGVDEFALSFDWGADAPARAWLVRLFADARISNADLHALTTTLSRRSGAPGVDVTMALPVRSSSRVRSQMGERYAAAWEITTSGPMLDDLAEDWVKAVREADETGVDALDEGVVEKLSAAIGLSRLSQAAHLRYLARLDEAAVVLDEYDRPVEMELVRWSQRERGDQLSGRSAMPRWALDYLSAQRDYPRRVELLTQAATRRLSHPVDIEILVTVAFRGSQNDARAAARGSLLATEPSATVTLAILELAPRIPRTAPNADLIASVTATSPVSTDDPAWELKTRRLLVETALDQLAAEGDDGVVDQLALILGESYAGRAMDNSVSLATDAALMMPADRGAAVLRARWDRLARTGGLGGQALEVERVLSKHAARIGLAQGPVQTFAAEQYTAFELMAITVAGESVDRAPKIQEVRAQVSAARRGAGDIVEQILAVERGFCRLWALRLGQGGEDL